MQQTENDSTTDTAEIPTDLPRIAGYRIVRRLGLGGMAMVYLAVQESLDREVAIKVMRPLRQLDDAQAARFEHEARIIAKLEHPSIVGIHEVGRTLGGELYYVMPYLARGDLSMRHYRDDEMGLIALLRALLDALGYAHARGIVHRDVKAENVLFDNADRPQLADFGIALAHREGDTRMTGDGLVIGSSAQMSPEQARAGAIDGRSDLYSLGVLVYELLTGSLPFHSSDPLSLALMHAQDPVPRLPDDKAHWQDFIDRAMAKRPEQRFRNAQAMRRALDPIERKIQRAATSFGQLRDALWPSPLLLVSLAALITVSLLSVALPSLREHLTPSAISSDVHVTEAAPSPIEKTLEQARAQFDAEQWLEPVGDNAAASWISVLDIEPGNIAAQSGLTSLIDAVAAKMQSAAEKDELESLRNRYMQIELMADQADLRNAATFIAAREQVAQAAAKRAKTELARADTSAARGWIDFAATLGYSDAELAMLRDQSAALPALGTSVRDEHGPELVLLPMRVGNATLSKPVLIMRDEVSRAEYAVFVTQSGREAARCRNRLSPLRLFDRRDWKDPGFQQSSNEPAVCVSHDDARAYAAWLTRRTGHQYRLPTRAEWRQANAGLSATASPCKLGNIADQSARGGAQKHACNDGFPTTAAARRYSANALGIYDLHGNVAEWSLDCLARAKGKDGDCTRRAALGLSWRDGPDATTAPRSVEPDRGYDDIGFRLVREL